MSLEVSYIVPEAHLKPIICIQYNPFRREIYTAGEDTLLKVWEAENGKLISSLSEHTGWITALLFCKDIKILFSVSIDGSLVAWNTATMKIIQRINTNLPIYSLAFNSRRQQLLAGYYKKVRVFQFSTDDSPSASRQLIETGSKPITCSEHSDVVSCMISCEGRYYSGGYDRKIVIYDIPHHGDLRLKVIKVIKDAHEAAITCMIFGKDGDNSWYFILI